jgi:hypothetical protein
LEDAKLQQLIGADQTGGLALGNVLAKTKNVVVAIK